MADVNFTPARDGTSSASTSQGNTNSYVFDVFVNHRGPDVKKGLASHIYHRLTDFGLAVFLDQEVLERGEGLKPQIEGAIRTASVHVAIFSPNYAHSRWCLDELVQMLESRSTIIPVFYKVEPADLRWTHGADRVYARALGELEMQKTLDGQPRYEPNTIKKWRDALRAVADIVGFELKDNEEEQLVHHVVQQVLKKVRKPLNVAKYPTGVDEKIKELDRTLSTQRQREKATVLGIVGLGGVGKTTLAKQFFNRERSNYDRSCFLFDVRSKSLPSLQSSLLKDLIQWNAQINSVAEGIESLKRVSPRALIILDDIDHINQLDALCAPVIDSIHVGSLILITSRCLDVLLSAGIEESSIYTLKGLNPQLSRQLFCLHAFGVDRPVIGFEEVVKKFLHVCNGLPLSLQVIGALLRGKHDLKHWDAQFRKTSNILPDDIQNTLRISYDALDSEEKQIFLDIACFFIGEDRDTASRVWGASNWEGFLGLWKLESRCLVEVDGQNRLRMHDHIRDLGRDIAENPEYRRRLCRFSKSFLLDVVADQSPVRGISMVDGNDSEQSFQSFDQSPVRGITMDSGNGNEQILENIAAMNLLRLQLLRGQGSFVGSLFSAVELRQLIYLRWEKCPISSISFTNLTRNLRVLYIQGQNLETLWQHESQAPLQLRELHINAPLSDIPESIGKLNQLEKIVLENSVFKTLPNDIFHQMHCLKHISLNFCNEMMSLPDSVAILTGLQTLNLCHCSSLQGLPDSVGALTGLQTLDLRSCSSLQGLPDSVGLLTGLQTLDLEGCSTLQGLPESVGHLTGLRSLRLERCASLQRLPDSVGQLIGLQTLDLGYCIKLQGLPDSVGQLTGVQTLNLCHCSSLQGLPDSVGALTGLQTLDLRSWSSLQGLPDSVGLLTGLQTLDLEGCASLQGLPYSVGQVMGLQSLNLEGCSTLQGLPESVAYLTGLRSLHLERCASLQRLPDSVGQLTGLQTLDLDYCIKLQGLPDSVGQLTGLQTLNLCHCFSLQELPDSVGGLTGLQTLDLRSCSTLQGLPDSVGLLTGLRSLHLEGCSGLQRLSDSFGDLANLQNIYLNGCSSLRRLPDSVGNVRNLQRIDLRGCSGLHMLPNSFSNLKKLRHVDLSKCSNLEMLPYSFGNLRDLQYINLSECSNLQMLPSLLENLKHLQYMDLSWCSNLQTLPNSLGNLRNLRHIDLSWCSNLQMLPISFGNLTNLQHINLSGCSNLPILPNSFGNLIQLKHLCLRKCYELTISSETLGQIRTLEWLEISGCYGIEVLPPQITNQRFLREMYLFCPFLKELPSTIGELSHLEILHLESSCLELLEMGELVSLQELQVRECVNLKSIQGLAQLTKLRRLDVANCSGLEELSGVEHLTSLEKLNASGCPNLQWGRGVLEQLDKQLKGCIIK